VIDYKTQNKYKSKKNKSILILINLLILYRITDQKSIGLANHKIRTLYILGQTFIYSQAISQ